MLGKNYFAIHVPVHVFSSNVQIFFPRKHKCECKSPYCKMYFFHTRPIHGRSSEIPRGREVLKVKILQAKYEVKLEFPGGIWGVGVQKKKPSIQGVWIFSGTAQL